MGRRNKQANENYGLNIRYIVVIKQIGCCGTETELVMSFHNIPNCEGMGKGTYSCIENKTHGII